MTAACRRLHGPYAWERPVVEAAARTLGHQRLAQKVLNVVLGGIEVAPWLGVALVLLVTWDLVLAGLLAVATYGLVNVDDPLKRLAGRGRPDAPDELGLPSGDTALATLWAALAFGPWTGLLVGGIVGIARMVLRRHWPLDVVAGLGLGAWFAIAVTLTWWAWLGSAR